MPYSLTTLQQFISAISTLLDDSGQVYWTVPEIQYAVYEGMYVWGAFSNYWRSRGVFNAVPPTTGSPPPPYYDLSQQLPTLRTRTWTLTQMVQEIQYHLLEKPSMTGVGMSGQISIQAILNAINYARDRFVLDARIPLTYHAVLGSPPPPDGMISFNQNSVYVHRTSWQDTFSSVWTSLWREDGWSLDKNNRLWTVTPGTPNSYSEAENSPLKLQLSPPPLNTGAVEAFTVDSLLVPLTSGSQTFQVPDEWVHAIKYCALARLLSTENQLKDMVRAEYADKRYQQSIEFTKDARSIIRVLCNSIPLPIDAITSLDAGKPYWRNQTGPPRIGGVMYDVLALSPGISDSTYGIAVDVVQAAPLPTYNASSATDNIQMGQEDLEYLTRYVVHYLSFKCGGNEFKSSMGEYDSFMQGVSLQKGVNKAKIRYFTPMMGQAQQEWAMKPDRLQV